MLNDVVFAAHEVYGVLPAGWNGKTRHAEVRHVGAFDQIVVCERIRWPLSRVYRQPVVVRSNVAAPVRVGGSGHVTRPSFPWALTPRPTVPRTCVANRGRRPLMELGGLLRRGSGVLVRWSCYLDSKAARRARTDWSSATRLAMTSADEACMA